VRRRIFRVLRGIAVRLIVGKITGVGDRVVGHTLALLARSGAAAINDRMPGWLDGNPAGLIHVHNFREPLARARG
jgi:hypothetical protein